MRKIRNVILGLLFLFPGCQAPADLTDQDKQDMVNAVKETSQNYWKEVSVPYDSASPEKMLAYWDMNSDKTWQTGPVTAIFNREILFSVADWEKTVQEIMQSRIATTPTISERYYTVLAPDKVLEITKGDYTVIGKDSTVIGPLTMVNTCIWARIEGEWKMQFMHESYGMKAQ